METKRSIEVISGSPQLAHEIESSERSLATGAKRQEGTRQTKAASVNERDLTLMKMIGEERMIRIDQAARLTGRRLGRVRRTVERLNQLGYINYVNVLAKEGDWPWLWLTEEGLKLIDLSHRYYKRRPPLRQLSHVFSIVEIRLFYATEHPEWRWLSERDLASLEPRRYKRKHLPDGALETPDGLILVEAEVSPKGESHLRRIMCELNARARTHYHCSDRVRDAVEHMKESEGLTRTHIFDLPGELLWPARKSGADDSKRSLSMDVKPPERSLSRKARRASLTKLDLELVRLFGEEKMMRLDHASRLTGRRVADLRRNVDRLRRLGYIHSVLVFAKDGELTWQWLTQQGLGLIDFDREYRRVLPSLYEFNTAFSVAETRLFYAEKHPDWTWLCERSLANLNLFPDRKQHLPTGALRTDSGLILVEVELTARHRSQLKVSMRENDRRARTHYHCADVARRGIEKVRESEGLERVRIYDVPGEVLWPAR